MKIKILASASQDLIDGYWFYAKQTEGIGECFTGRIPLRPADAKQALIHQQLVVLDTTIIPGSYGPWQSNPGPVNGPMNFSCVSGEREIEQGNGASGLTINIAFVSFFAAATRMRSRSSTITEEGFRHGEVCTDSSG